MRVLVVLGLVLLTACAALRDDMRRAETSFEAARYEDVLVWLDDLEPHVAEMDQSMRARFYYLRGITAFRLGRRGEARHALALCRATAGEGLSALKPAWRPHLEAALEELGAGTSREST